jgi:hypothetical protein
MYCGIDLHARNNYHALLNQERKLITQGRYDNDLGVIINALEPYREEIVGIAVESTFNWYWLVDGLMDHGYKLHLANTNEAKQYDGLKYADDRHDAGWLALLLLLGILPEGYIYPKEERPNRDLCRRRAFLVRKRTSMLTSMRGAYGCWSKVPPIAILQSRNSYLSSLVSVYWDWLGGGSGAHHCGAGGYSATRQLCQALRFRGMSLPQKVSYPLPD